MNLGKFPSTAPLWHEIDFVPGRVQLEVEFRAETILKHHPDKNRLLGWTQGVRLYEFVDPEATDLFQGRRYKGSDLTPIENLNHIPQEVEDWTSVELSQLEHKACIARWDLVESTDESPAPQDMPSLRDRANETAPILGRQVVETSCVATHPSRWTEWETSLSVHCKARIKLR